LVRSLGAARIIDYTTSDFTKDTGRYDFVIDAVGKYSFKMCKHLLTEKGIYTSSHPNIFQALFTPLMGGKKELFPIPKDLIRNLARIRDLVERGEFRPVIDKTLPLDDISEAYSYVGSGRKVGNVIIRIGNP
jgi:NADPH:quinone reductase-like Zn-dependent oxidoreductase